MFKGQTIWITGASSGIGEALAKQFVQRGASVILSSRNEAELERVRSKCTAALEGADVHILPLDVLDEAAMEAKVSAACAFTGQIDMLINNAGISQRSLVLDTEMDTYRQLFDVDFFGQIALTKALLPLMIRRGSGHIAVTSSVAGKIGVPLRTGYCAVKHAVMGFFDALRAEMVPHGIQVSTITPGYIKTNIAYNALVGDGSNFARHDKNISAGMDVDECAAVIVRGFEKGKPEIAVGRGLEMFGLYAKRFFPRLAFKFAVKAGGVD